MTRSTEFQLICTILFGLLAALGKATVTDRIKTDGDVTVEGLFKIYENEAGICSTKISVQSVMTAEAVKWYLKQLNTAGKLPVKIGFEVQKTCGLPHMASEAAVGILSGVLLHTSNKTVIGVLGPEYSSEAIHVSRILSSVNEQDRLIQVGFSTTAALLADVTAFPNFFRVVPNDVVQIEVMTQAMQSMHWNMIAIIYENNVYSREGALSLKARAEEIGICVSLLLESKIENMHYLIQDIINSNHENVTAIVYFGAKFRAESTFISSQQNKFNKSPVLMFSVGISLDPDSFINRKGEVVNIGKGAYTVTPTYRNVDEFRKHWDSIFSNRTKFEQESLTNPWLFDVYRKIASCVDTECPFTPIDAGTLNRIFTTQPLFIQYAIIGAHAFAKTIKIIHSRRCGKGYGVCEEFVNSFRQGHVIEEMKNSVYLDFEKDFLWTPNCFRDVVLRINSSGELTVLRDQVLYELYNFQPVNQSLFRFAKVGKYNGEINVSLANIRDINFSGKPVAWPNVRKGQCPTGKICSGCLSKIGNIDDYLIDPGDVYVIASLPISEKSGLQACGNVRTQNGYQLIEAIRYAIEQVNDGIPDESVAFSKLHIGLVVLNSCNSGAVIERKIYNLHRDGVRLPNGTIIDINNNILGYIGDVSSQVSLAVADTLTQLDQVQISIASTSTLLSDRVKYPNFMRVVTPDSEQAKTIVAILKELRSNFVQLIYSEDAYGENGRDYIKVSARANDICVVQEIKVRDTDNFFKFYEELRFKPHAKVVILFLSAHLEKMIKTLSRQMSKGEFSFIGSETWGKNPLLLNKWTVGSISVSLEMSIEDKLENRLTHLQPKPYTQDPWSMAYLQKKYSCYFNDSFDKSSKHECKNLLNVTSMYGSDMWSAAASVATTSLLKGAKSLFHKKCGKSASALCHDFLVDKKGLVEEIKKLATNTEDGVEMKVFNNNSDGNRGYKIYQIQKDSETGEMFYELIGRYSLAGHYTFDGTSTLSSKCPNVKACNECLGPKQDSSKDSDSILRPQWIVLLVLLVVCVVVIVTLSLVIRHMNAGRRKDTDSSPYLTPSCVDENKLPTENAETCPPPIPCYTDYSDIKLETVGNRITGLKASQENPAGRVVRTQTRDGTREDSMETTLD